jgi:uncharacterized membrane protein
MTQVHLHLLITHLPIFGSILGSLVLVHGLWTKSNSTKIASYNLFIISAIGAAIAYFTGEGAAEAVEKMPGVLETMIERHEDFAVYALVSLIVLGFVSLFALFASFKNLSIAKPISMLVLFVSLVSFGLVARTGYLGGQIRHTEIATNTTTTIDQGKNEKDDD